MEASQPDMDDPSLPQSEIKSCQRALAEAWLQASQVWRALGTHDEADTCCRKSYDLLQQLAQADNSSTIRHLILEYLVERMQNAWAASQHGQAHDLANHATQHVISLVKSEPCSAGVVPKALFLVKLFRHRADELLLPSGSDAQQGGEAPGAGGSIGEGVQLMENCVDLMSCVDDRLPLVADSIASLAKFLEKDITLRLASYLMDSQGIPDSISRASRCIQTYVQKWGEGGNIPPMVHCIKLCMAAHYADLPAANISLANLSGHPESRHPLITDAVIRCLQLLTQPPHQSHDEGHQAIRSDLLSSIRRAIATLARLPVASQEEPRSSSAATDLLDGTAATQPGLYLVQICASVLDCKGTRHFGEKRYSRCEKLMTMTAQLAASCRSANKDSFMKTGAPCAELAEGQPQPPAKCWLTAALCCLGQKNPMKALEHLSKAEEYDANTSNCAFVRLKANLSLGDDAAATAAIHKLTQCDDFEAGYLRISCSEALENGMEGVALKALQLLHVEVRRSRAKGKASTSQEQSGAHHGSVQLSYADKLSEATILRCILTLAIKQLEAKGADAKEPAHETAEADERTHGAAVLSKYDQLAGFFNTARLSAEESGPGAFLDATGLDTGSGHIGQEGTEKAIAELQWFATTAWNWAMHVWAEGESLSCSHTWQIASVIWQAASTFFKMVAHIQAETRQLEVTINSSKSWHVQASLMGALAKLESLESHGPQMSDETWRGTMKHVGELIATASAVVHADAYGYRPASTSADTQGAGSNDWCHPWVLYLQFRMEALRKNWKKQIDLLHQLDACDTPACHLVCTAVAERSVDNKGQGYRKDVACMALQILLRADSTINTNEWLRSSSRADPEVQKHAEALIILACNKGSALVQQGKYEMAVGFLNASLGIQRSSRLLESRKKDIEAMLHTVQEYMTPSSPAAALDEDLSLPSPIGP
eukprot:jgi/Tetstr1/437735/TSEL_026389.t1